MGKNHDIMELSVSLSVACLGNDRTGACYEVFWLFISCFSPYISLPSSSPKKHGRGSFYFPFAFIMTIPNKNARQLAREIEELWKIDWANRWAETHIYDPKSWLPVFTETMLNMLSKKQSLKKAINHYGVGTWFTFIKKRLQIFQRWNLAGEEEWTWKGFPWADDS